MSKKLWFATLVIAILTAVGLYAHMTSNHISIADIQNKTWVRGTTSCTEFLRLSKLGKFSYSEACGNAVDAFDIYNRYTYHAGSKTLTITSDDFLVPKILPEKMKIVSYTEDKLVIEYKGELREFVFKE